MPPGRAGRPEAASSVAPIPLRYERSLRRPRTPIAPSRRVIISSGTLTAAARAPGRGESRREAWSSGGDYARLESGSTLDRRRIQTPSGVTVPSVGTSGGGGRPRSFPSGPLSPGGYRSRLGQALDPGEAAMQRPPSSRGIASAGELAQRQRRVAETQARDLSAAPARARRRRPSRSRRRMARSWTSAARLVRTMLAWSALARRFARARVAATTASSPSAQRRLVCAEEREQLADRLRPLRVGDRVAGPRSCTASAKPSAAASSARKAADSASARAKLEVRVARPAGRAGGEERAAQVRAPGSTRGRRRGVAAARAAPGSRRERPPRSAPGWPGRRPRDGAGSACPARTPAACTSGSRTGRRRSGAA